VCYDTPKTLNAGRPVFSRGASRVPSAALPPRFRRASAALSLLILALAALPLPAWAVAHGSYKVVLSGGEIDFDPSSSSQPSPAPYSGSATVNGGTRGGGHEYFGSGSNIFVNCKGQITATCTWTPDPANPNEPAPTAVIVGETASASWRTSYGGHGDCANGLTGQVTTAADGLSGSSNGARTSVKGGATITLTCTPTANAYGSPQCGNGAASVSYSVSLSPVLVDSSGPILDGGALKVITGQQVTASLLGIPSGSSPTYLWSASGDTFYTYNENAASKQLVKLSDSPAYTAGSTFACYDKSQDKIVITCKVSLTLGGTAQTLTATSQQISCLRPSAKWLIETGFVQSCYAPTLHSGGYQLRQNPATSNPGGEYWHDIAITVPSPFSGGQGAIIQLVTPDSKTYKDGSSSPIVPPNNGKQGLDNQPLYTSWTLPTLGKESDSPAALFTDLNSGGYQGYNTVTVIDKYDTWLMYKPGGSSSVWVPLQTYGWGWSFTSKWATSDWVLTAASPANAAASPSYTASDTSTPPTWSLVQNNNH
jgi:hypothetical protein